MPIDREHLRSALEHKGFRCRETDHDYYLLYVGGQKTSIRTKLSRGTKYKIYSDSLLGSVCVQLGLTKRELLEFVECPLSEEEYVSRLRERRRIR